MLATCCGLLLAVSSVAVDAFVMQEPATTLAVGQKLTYSGRLEPLAAGGSAESSRSFRVVFLVTEATASGGWRVAWVVEEAGGKPRWPWSQRFGSVPFARSLQPTSDRETPAIQGSLDGMTRVIPLALPIFAGADKLAADAEWDDGDRHFEVATREEVAGQRVWVVACSTKLGGRSIDWVDEKQPLVVRHRTQVFLGQGVQHELRLDLDRVETLAAEDLSTHSKAHAALATLRGPVKDKLTESANASPAATPAFLDQARAALGRMSDDRKAGPYAELATDLVRETRAVLDRQHAIEKLRGQVVGKPAPDFTLTTTRDDKVSLAEFKGKPVVLHFWEYRSEPKIAPYGETGYLDFLWRQREKDGVRVLGIAVEDRLRANEGELVEPTARATSRKDTRAFCDFMNLSYPVAFDDSKLIDKFGNPRPAGGKLPLYIVIAPDGTIAEFYVGLWSATADEGLKELDQRLQKLAK